MTKRSHFKQTEPLADRLEHFAKAMREKAATLPRIPKGKLLSRRPLKPRRRPRWIVGSLRGN